MVKDKVRVVGHERDSPRLSRWGKRTQTKEYDGRGDPPEDGKVKEADLPRAPRREHSRTVQMLANPVKSMADFCPTGYCFKIY